MQFNLNISDAIITICLAIILLVIGAIGLFAQENQEIIDVTTKNEYFVGDKSISQNTSSLDAKIKMYGKDDLGIYSSISTSVRHTEKEENHYYHENLYSIGYNLIVTSQMFMFFNGINSSSDKPFNSEDEIDYYSVGLMTIWGTKNQFLSVGYVYTNNKLIAGLPQIPIPFASYGYFSEKFTFMFGIETFAKYNFTEKVWTQLTAGIFGGSYRFDIGYNFTETSVLKALVAMEDAGYKPVDRPEKNMYLNMHTLRTGLEFDQTLNSVFKLNAFAGYTFESEYYYQEYASLGSNPDQIDTKELPNSLVASLSIQMLL